MAFLDPHPVLFTIAGFRLTAHGLLFALGAETALLVSMRLATRLGLSAASLPEKVLLVFVAGLAGARAGFFLSYPSQFSSISQVLYIWNGGLVSYWGMVTGALAAWLAFRKERNGQWADVVTVSALAAWSVGRWGNYWAADSIGVASSRFTAFYGHVPIQLMESLLCAVLSVLLYLYLASRTRPGLVTGLGLLGYGLGRALIDSWRDEGIHWSLHSSQWISLVMAAAAAIYLTSLHVRRTR